MSEDTKVSQVSLKTLKLDTDAEPVSKAVGRKQAMDAAVRCYADGDIRRARNIVESLGHDVPENGLKDLLVELAGEACKAVARAILRGA